MADDQASSTATIPEEVAPPCDSTATKTNGTAEVAPVEGVFDKVEALKVAANLFVQGKRHLLVKDIASAISSLGEACQLMSEANGPLGADNAEAHFYYGKALLEQSRLDLAVFDGGRASTEDKEGSDDDEEDEEEEEEEESNEAETGEKMETDADEKEKTKDNEDAPDTKKEEDLSTPSPTSTTNNPNQTATEEGVQDLSSSKPSSSAGTSAVNGEGVEGETKEAGEEEQSDLELAWEILEIAKIGYTVKLDVITAKLQEQPTDVEEKAALQKSSAHLQKRLSETHSLLGEVATESENYTEAVEEFKMAIQILMDIEGPDSREVAQYYFQMGLAYAFGKLFQDAIGSFKHSKEIIERRIANLTHKIENKLTAKDLGIEVDDPNYTEEVEISELQALLPELEEKVKDTMDAETENNAAVQEVQQEQEILLKSSPIKNPNLPAANDISHLVKKRKNLDSALADIPVKRVCTSGGSVVVAEQGKVETNGTKKHENGSSTTKTTQ